MTTDPIKFSMPEPTATSFVVDWTTAFDCGDRYVCAMVVSADGYQRPALLDRHNPDSPLSRWGEHPAISASTTTPPAPAVPADTTTSKWRRSLAALLHNIANRIANKQTGGAS